jgi:hypothetical protein
LAVTARQKSYRVMAHGAAFDVGKMADAKLREGRWRSGVQHRKTQVCIQLVDVDVNVSAT